MIKAIKHVFQSTPPELSADIIDGGRNHDCGTSQLRNFPELIRRRTGVRRRRRPFYFVVKVPALL